MLCVPNNVNANVTFFNRSLYDAVARERQVQGTAMPLQPWNHWTWWDYVQLCQSLTRESADGRRYETFGSGGPGFGGGLSDFIYQAGGSLLNEDGTRILLDSQAGAIAAQFVCDLVSTFHMAPSTEDRATQTGDGGWGGQSILGLFTGGKLGTVFIGRWGLIKARREARFTVEIHPLPRYVPYEEWERWMGEPRIRADHTRRDGPWGELSEASRNRGKAVELGGRVTGIRRGTPHPREAFCFLEYLSSPDFNQLITKDADAFGSRKEFSVRYFSRPDPEFPEEAQHRLSLLDAMEHTREERAAAHGAAFEVTRLQNALTTNLLGAPGDPIRDQQGRLVYSPDGQPIPIKNVAAVAGIAVYKDRWNPVQIDGRPMPFVPAFPLLKGDSDPLLASSTGMLRGLFPGETEARVVYGNQVRKTSRLRFMVSNCVRVLRDPDIKFSLYGWNSLLVACCVMVGQVLSSAMGGFAFSRLEWRGRDAVFLLYLGTLMVPGIVTLLPNYVTLQSLGWLDSFKALIIPAMFTAFGTFMMRQFMMGLPKGLEEAAEIDGADTWRVFWTVVMPLSKPALITLAIFSFTGTWQSFTWPLITTHSEGVRVLPVALRYFDSSQGTNYSLLMAGSVLMMLPMILLFIFGQRFFVRGIQLGALKG